MTRLLPLLLLPFLQGCVGLTALQVELQGTDHRSHDGALSFTPSGHPLVYDHAVDLPRAQEDQRYGLVLVDTTLLPAGWRLRHDQAGGVMVSAVDLASPLARAGLTSTDLIETVDGLPVETPQQVVDLLEERDEVALGVLKPGTWDPVSVTIAASADPDMLSTSAWLLPGVFNVASSSTGTGVTVGPVGMVFASRSALLSDGYRYVERTEWGFLFDWFAYRSETNLETGETKRRFTLFWFFDFGDGETL